MTGTVNGRAGGRETVGVVLMKSEEATAAVDYVTDSRPDIRVEDRNTYYLLETEGTIRLPLAELESYLGKPLSMAQFLVVMSTFYGRAQTEDDAFIVTSAMSQLEEPVPS